MSELSDIARSLAVIAGTVQHIQSDMKSLRREITAVRDESRDNMLALRGDLVVHDAAKNEVLAQALKDLAANKKKIDRVADKVQELIAVVQELDSGKYIIPGKSPTGPLDEDNRQKKLARQAFHLMRGAFNEDELRELCMDFFIDYEDIPGNTRSAKLMAIIDWFRQRHTVDILINWAGGQRPNLEWPKTKLDQH